MIHEICRRYRLQKMVKLSEVDSETDIKTLSAFEMGRSSNINHLYKYVELSKKFNEFNYFMLMITNDLRKGNND